MPQGKYYDKYSYIDSLSGMEYKRSKLGDGIKEPYTNGNGSAWHADVIRLLTAPRYFAMRGGVASTTTTYHGIFVGNMSFGRGGISETSRPVIAP